MLLRDVKCLRALKKRERFFNEIDPTEIYFISYSAARNIS